MALAACYTQHKKIHLCRETAVKYHRISAGNHFLGTLHDGSMGSSKWGTGVMALIYECIVYIFSM